MSKEVLRFLDEEGRIKAWPAKQAMKMQVLEYLSSKFEPERIYSEKEINNIITNWHTFNDYFILRRGLVDGKYLSRTRDGAEYWKSGDASQQTDAGAKEG